MEYGSDEVKIHGHLGHLHYPFLIGRSLTMISSFTITYFKNMEANINNNGADSENKKMVLTLLS